MLSLRHPNIVTMLGLVIDMKCTCIVMEFLQRGTLYDLVRDGYRIFESEHIKTLAIDICNGMIYLHGNSILHRDLKTKNILLDEKWSVKVADFGLSTYLEEYKSAHTLTACGTPAYAAPEILRKEKYSYPVDVFSFSMILYEMMTRRYPFEGIPTYRAVLGVATQGWRPRLSVNEDKPKEISRLMKACWNEISADRPTFSECLEYLQDLSFEKPMYTHPYKLDNISNASINDDIPIHSDDEEFVYVNSGSSILYRSEADELLSDDEASSVYLLTSNKRLGSSL